MSCQYAERLPIGLEKVIRTVSSDTVKNFYKKWYHLSNMAVIAVGDFADTQVHTGPVSFQLMLVHIGCTYRSKGVILQDYLPFFFSV